MTGITGGRTPKKRQSEFQKLWAKAERLKQHNARFRARLDEVMDRIRTDIAPVEVKAARQHIPLLLRLLRLGQRKSLTHWQRETLDEWIREILEPLQGSGPLDAAVLEETARYDAFRHGIALNEASATPLVEQLRAHLEGEEARAGEENHPFRKDIEREVEHILDRTLGPAPPPPAPPDRDDLFRDELHQAQQSQFEAYQQARQSAREALLAEMLEQAGFADEDEDKDDFDFGFDPFEPDTPLRSEDDAPAISNAVFKRLFRSTAAQLHPDREHDPQRREQKHALMSRLLEARKQGDVMTVMQMYQDHVGTDTALSKKDERQLLEALRRQVFELECEQEEYTFESPLHQLAFEKFYFTSARKTDRAFQQYIENIEQAAQEAEALAREITSLQRLKPHLERRYEESRFRDPLEAMEAFFDLNR